MIQHILFFTFKEEAMGMKREELIVEAKKRLEALEETVSCIKKMVVGVNFNPSQFSYDISLYTEFETKEDLQIYQDDKDHIKVKEFMGEVVAKRAVVDAVI